MIETVNVLGGLLVAAATVLVTYLLTRHKPKVDRRTAAVAEKQLSLDSLRAVSLEWREYAQVQTNRALAAEASAKEAAASAVECKQLSEEALRRAESAELRAERAERYNSILLEHWPEGHMLPRQP